MKNTYKLKNDWVKHRLFMKENNGSFDAKEVIKRLKKDFYTSIFRRNT